MKTAVNYHSEHILIIRRETRDRLTRKELRDLHTRRHGCELPKDVNLRNYVSKYHAHQQAINGGAEPSDFWQRAAHYGRNTR